MMLNGCLLHYMIEKQGKLEICTYDSIIYSYQHFTTHSISIFTQLFNYSFIYYIFIYSFMYLSIYWFIYLFIYSYTSSLHTTYSHSFSLHSTSICDILGVDWLCHWALCRSQKLSLVLLEQGVTNRI